MVFWWLRKLHIWLTYHGLMAVRVNYSYLDLFEFFFISVQIKEQKKEILVFG